MPKTPYRPADDGPGYARLRAAAKFEQLRLDTLRMQQRALASARVEIERVKKTGGSHAPRRAK